MPPPAPGLAATLPRRHPSVQLQPRCRPVGPAIATVRQQDQRQAQLDVKMCDNTSSSHQHRVAMRLQKKAAGAVTAWKAMAAAHPCGAVSERECRMLPIHINQQRAHLPQHSDCNQTRQPVLQRRVCCCFKLGISATQRRFQGWHCTQLLRIRATAGHDKRKVSR